MDPSPPLDADRLLAHAAWVRRLAGQLVGDPDAADDAAQDALAAALEGGPREASRTKAWLAAVVRSFARRRARSDERRARREVAAARPERVHSAAEVVERATASRAVVDAVLALPEPYRSTVLLRWFDDVAPARIAELRGEPVETVRTRLKRGHALLREQLAGLQALAMLAAPAGTMGAAAAGAGGFVVTTIGKIAIGTAAVAAIAVTWSVHPWRASSGDVSNSAAAFATSGADPSSKLPRGDARPAEAAVAPESVRALEDSSAGASTEVKPPAVTTPKVDERWAGITAENWQRIIRVDDAQELHAFVDGLDSESLDLSAFLRFVSENLADSYVVPGYLDRQSQPTKSGSRSSLGWAALYENANGEPCAWLPHWSHDSAQNETAGMVLPSMPWNKERSIRLGLPEDTDAQAALYFKYESGKVRGFFNLTIWPRSKTTAEMESHEAELKRLADDHRLPSRLDFELGEDGGRLTWLRSGASRALTATEAAQLTALFESIRSTGRRLEKEN